MGGHGSLAFRREAWWKLLLQKYTFCAMKSNLDSSFVRETVGKVLPVCDISQLIGNDMGSANLCVDVAVRVPIDPIVNTAVSDIVAQFHGKGTIDSAAAKFRGSTKSCWHMVGEYDFCFCGALCNCLFDKM